MAVLKLSEEIEAFKHAKRQQRVRMLKTLQIKVIREERWNKRNDTQMERAGNDGYFNKG